MPTPGHLVYLPSPLPARTVGTLQFLASTIFANHKHIHTHTITRARWTRICAQIDSADNAYARLDICCIPTPPFAPLPLPYHIFQRFARTAPWSLTSCLCSACVTFFWWGGSLEVRRFQVPTELWNFVPYRKPYSSVSH